MAKGEIALVGERMSTLMISVPAHQRPVGLVFQDYALFPHLTWQEHLPAFDWAGASGFCLPGSHDARRI
ncbi:MAG: hypothetical protein ACR5LF_08495 [Symbiopectobacterium sp.]